MWLRIEGKILQNSLGKGAVSNVKSPTKELCLNNTNKI